MTRFTDENVRRILDGWPQAVSTDTGDLRLLHDIANQGAQAWGGKLGWPDYAWLELDRVVGSRPHSTLQNVWTLVEGPPGSGPHADLGWVNRARIEVSDRGRYPIANRIECWLEVKAIKADHLPKFLRYEVGPDTKKSWQDFVDLRLQNVFSRVRDADGQLRDGRKVLGKAVGVTIVVNEGSAKLPVEIAHAALGKALQELPNTDAIVYLADGSPKSHFAVIQKRRDHEVVTRFQEEFSKMLDAVDWTASVPTVRGGPYPRLTMRIDMDDRSLEMCRTWSTGWRAADDPAPLPTPNIRFSVARLEDFESGLLPRNSGQSR
jgi:hypothetical protein